MSHKKVGKEESERRARANLKDFHWWVIIHIFIITKMVYKNEGGLICKPRTRVVKETLAPEQSRMSFVD